MFFDGARSLDILVSCADFPVVLFNQVPYGLSVDSVFLLKRLVPMKCGDSGAQCSMLHDQNAHVTSVACMSMEDYKTQKTGAL